MYQPVVYQFRFTVIIAGCVQSVDTERMTQAEAWSMSGRVSAELAQVYADYAVRVECV